MVIGNAITLGGGSGGGEAYAAISVTYPAGSICTCSQTGQDTLTAGDTSGAWLFVVPGGGEWTIEITDGTETASEVVTISAKGDAKTLSLDYAYFLFKNGAIVPFDTWTEKNATATIGETIAFDYNSSSYSHYTSAFTTDKIDVTGYTNLVVEGTFENMPTDKFKFGLSNSKPTSASYSFVSYGAITDTATVWRLPITTQSGSFYIALYGEGKSATVGIRGNVTKIYLEN